VPTTAIACSFACAVALVPGLVAAQPAGAIDWQRRVLQATGRGAPDLNAPSIAVARLAAQRAATASAQRNALAALSAVPLDGGGSVGALLANDGALRTAVEKKLRGLRVVHTRYFSDGGVVLETEMSLDELPPGIAARLKPPVLPTPAAALPPK
jgi:hypothetical protein